MTVLIHLWLRISVLPNSWHFEYRGNTADTRGRAFVVYDDIHDAKQAVDHLSGFNVRDRYVEAIHMSVCFSILFH